jgi:hypothetical protein
MAQETENYAKLLADAQTALSRQSELTAREKELTDEVAEKEKQIAAEREVLRKTVDSTLKKRRSELESSYDGEIGKAEKRLRDAKGRREKAKNQGVRDRIHEETAELREENTELREKFVSILREDHAPAVCRTNFYYALYFPRCFSEFLTLLVCFAVCFAVVPIGIYLLLPQQRTLWLILIYLADIFVFGWLYVLIGNATRNRHAKALKDAVRCRGLIRSNKKKIRVIISSIRREGDDDAYDLGMYDDEIAKLEQELADINAKKRDAVSTFDSVTSTILTDEISVPAKKRIKELTDACAGSRNELEDTQQKLKENKIQIADQYESYIGRDYLEPEKLKALRDILDQGAAANISEAKEVYCSRLEKQ